MAMVPYIFVLGLAMSTIVHGRIANQHSPERYYHISSDPGGECGVEHGSAGGGDHELTNDGDPGR